MGDTDGVAGVGQGVPQERVRHDCTGITEIMGKKKIMFLIRKATKIYICLTRSLYFMLLPSGTLIFKSKKNIFFLCE